MRNSLRTICAVICLAAMLMSLCACGSSDAAKKNSEEYESTAGKDITAAAGVDDVISLNCNRRYSFNPLIATSHSNQLICALVYENMIELDNNFEVIPNLIYDWDYSEDGTSWILYVDETHTFHDGTPVTSKDMRYSLERAINSDRYKGRFSSVQGVSWDTGKVYVSLGIGDTDFIKLLNIPIIQSGTYGEDYPMGSGPYMYNEDYTAIMAYDGYVGPTKLRPDNDDEEATGESESEENEEADEPITFPADIIYIVEYSDAESLIDAFEDGYVDIVLNDPSSYSNLGYASTNDFHDYATTNLHYVACNEEGNLTQFANFRYALNYAFDREFLVDMLNGNAVAAAVPMYPTCSLYPTTFAKGLAYNLELCKRVLENAGIKDFDEDGRLEMNGSAEDLELNFILCSDSSAKAGVANRFASDMNSIGLTVNVYELTWDKYITALEEGEFEVSKNKKEKFDLYYAEVKLRNNFDMTEILGVRTEDNELTNINYTNSRDGNYEQMMNAYLGAGKLEKEAKYLEFCNYLAQNATIIPIGFEKQQVITRRSVMKGVNPNMGNPLYDFTNWTIIMGETE